jgi:prepilin-type N-terminal cleavage/methylation domain-containing protein/prepilin-type processing-associated H-X9-DG protein
MVRGFSLIELLLVVAIILVLATLYWGPNKKGSRQRAVMGACQKNLETLYIPMQLYANDHAGKFPLEAGARNSEEALAPLVPRYTSDTSVFICPGSKDSKLPSGESFRKRRISYAYYMGRGPTNSSDAIITDRQVDSLPKPAGGALFSASGKPPGNNHGQLGGNLLFGDGHVEQSPPQSRFALPIASGDVLLNP